MKIKSLKFQRGTVSYKVYGTTYTEKVYDIILNGKKIGYIYHETDLQEWFATRDYYTCYFCGGLTLKEVKETVRKGIEQTSNLTTLLTRNER